MASINVIAPGGVIGWPGYERRRFRSSEMLVDMMVGEGRAGGDDVRELLHDGHPTACVGDAAFAYVNAFKAHVNVGFFRGTDLPDPAGLLEGNGKYMRHVKLRPGDGVDVAALTRLIESAYTDMKNR